jgi:hypothetical protein
MFHLILIFILLTSSSVNSTTVTQGTVHAVSKSKYGRAHSLGDSYQFQPRDGWQNVNVTNLQYKYPRFNTPDSNQQGSPFEKRGNQKSTQSQKKDPTKPTHKGEGEDALGGTLKHILGGVWNGLKALGQPEPVTITWCVRTMNVALHDTHY